MEHRHMMSDTKVSGMEIGSKAEELSLRIESGTRYEVSLSIAKTDCH